MILGMQRWITIAAVVLVGACYRSAPPPASPAPPAPASPVDQERQASYAHARFSFTQPAREERSVIAAALARLGEFTDEMCACPDRACADAVSQEMTRWSTELSKDHVELKPTDEEMEEAKQITERLSKCMMTAMGYGNPPPPPTP